MATFDQQDAAVDPAMVEASVLASGVAMVEVTVSALFVTMEGPTGVGKTTLAGRLAAELDAVAVFDAFDANPFLPDLLAAQSPDDVLALRTELTFVALRVAQLRHIADVLAGGRTVVADWALLKQPIFAATTLPAADTARIADYWVGVGFVVTDGPRPGDHGAHRQQMCPGRRHPGQRCGTTLR